MLERRVESPLSEPTVDLIGDRYRPVMSSGTSDPDVQAVLALLHIERSQLFYHLNDLLQELLRDLMLQDVMADLLVVSRQFPQDGRSPTNPGGTTTISSTS